MPEGQKRALYVIWQCRDKPEHRGWREATEPRGTCDYCLAITAFEREVRANGNEARP